MGNKNKSQTGKKNNNSCNNSNSGRDRGLGLAAFSYTDFILLSSTISYALAEELSEIELSLFIAFLEMVISDLALLATQERVQTILSIGQAEQNIVEEAQEGVIIKNAVTTPTVGRNSKAEKRKRIKKVKKK